MDNPFFWQGLLALMLAAFVVGRLIGSGRL